jgi:hypothetical protein
MAININELVFGFTVFIVLTSLLFCYNFSFSKGLNHPIGQQNKTNQYITMQAQNVSKTQPIIDHAYGAVEIRAGQQQPSRPIVYKGFVDGRYIVSDGTSSFRATRTSKPEEPPVFKFDVADKLN